MRTGVGVAGRQRRLVSFTLEFVHLKHYHVSAMRRICSHFLDTSSVVFQDFYTLLNTLRSSPLSPSHFFSMQVVPKVKENSTTSQSFKSLFPAYSFGALTSISGKLCQLLGLTYTTFLLLTVLADQLSWVQVNR